jgi:SH3 domain protein
MFQTHLRKINSLVRATGLVAALFVAVSAQTSTQLQVIKNVNLRSDPSTSNDAITLLHRPDNLELLSPEKVGGYYHIRTIDGKTGWVWARNVKMVSATDTTSTNAPPATLVESTWNAAAPLDTTFSGEEGPCPFNGNGSDPDQFRLKNRADTPPLYHDVTWDAINSLPFPGKTDGHYAKPHRKDWRQDQLSVIQPFEGKPVRVVGYIVAIKPQSGGSGEGTNCNFNHPADTDTHIALVATAGDVEKNSIVIEWTPRFLKQHPNWTKAKLLPWLRANKPVRVSGFLMVDPDHVNHLGRFRDTLWEIHPITKLEVFENGTFVDMDALP